MSASISVVIAYFNSSATILRALESVLDQSVPPKEILIIDDGSSSESKVELSTIISGIKSSEIPILIIQKDLNSGAASARNLGWNNSSSKYIAFLDSDDVWHFKKLELQISFMESHSLDISAHGYIENGDMYFDKEPKPVNWYKFKDFLIKNRCSTPTVVVRQDFPFRFPEGKRYSEDYELWLQISYFYPIPVLNVVLARGFKNSWGYSGLSSHLSKMFFGQICSYKSVWDRNMISAHTFCILLVWSFSRYLRRVLFSFFRRIKTRFYK